MKKFTEENECYNYILKTKFQELVSDSSYVGGFEDGFNHALEQLALHNVSGSLTMRVEQMEFIPEKAYSSDVISWEKGNMWELHELFPDSQSIEIRVNENYR